MTLEREPHRALDRPRPGAFLGPFHVSALTNTCVV